MPEVQPLRALHYDLGKAGALERLIAPPYDVIDAEARTELAARNPYNAVIVDLPVGGDDRYERAAAIFSDWKRSGIVVADTAPALWPLEQTYRTPDGTELTRRGFFCAVRVTDYGEGRVRPHERTHPAPKEDRLNLMRATKANLSPIFALYPDPDSVAWSSLERATMGKPWGDVEDDDGTRHRLLRIDDAHAIEAVQRQLADSTLLIADGHHRYETARVYADEIGGEGTHRYVLMCLVSTSDPGLTVLPTHRLVTGLDDDRRERLASTLERDFRTTEVPVESLTESITPNSGPPVFGFIDGTDGRAFRLELASTELADRALGEHSAVYRRLDAAVLEKVLLERVLGLDEDAIAHQRGIGYARDVDEALRRLRAKDYELAFILRPTPVDQVRAVAEEGETMPPKSTFFFPKLPSGLLFNPLD
jgi:uncharacterized protein (DUF1015 family)